MDDGAVGVELRPDLRRELERVAEELGLGVGESELSLRFRDGRLRWWETRRVRAPASELERPVVEPA